MRYLISLGQDFLIYSISNLEFANVIIWAVPSLQALNTSSLSVNFKLI